MKAVKIEWDVDSIDDLESLPTEIELPCSVNTDDEASDYITDITGFCHKGFALVDA